MSTYQSSKIIVNCAKAAKATVLAVGVLVNEIINDIKDASLEMENLPNIYVHKNDIELIKKELQSNNPNLEIIKNSNLKFQKDLAIEIAKESAIEIGFSQIEVTQNGLFLLDETKEKGILVKTTVDKEKSSIDFVSEAVGFPYPECEKVQEKFTKKMEDKGVLFEKIVRKKTSPLILPKNRNFSSVINKNKIKSRR